MNIRTILWAAFIAIAYATWPILGKWSKATGQWVNTVVVVGTIIPVALLSVGSMIKTPINNLRSLLLLLIAGIINGIAVYVYGMKATDEKIPTGTFVMTVSVMFFVFTPIIDWCINGNALSLKQSFGILFAGCAIYLLKG